MPSMTGVALGNATVNVPAAQFLSAINSMSGQINYQRQETYFPVNVELAEAATAVAAINKLLYQCHGATATIIAVEASIVVQATGADRTVTIDLKKSTGGGAFATVLSATVGFTNASTILVPVAGTISSASLVDGDILEAVVTVAGAAGNQAKGLILTLWIAELP